MNQKNFLSLVGLAAIVIILFVLLFSGGSTGPAPSDTVDSETGETSEDVSPEPEAPEVDAEDGEDVSAATETEEVVIDLTGQSFAFSQDEIRVPLGATVTINFQSVMGFHDWVVDQYAATDQVSETDGVTSVTFVADEAGEFEYYCSVGMHRALGMVGTLIVE